jgi:hypothetical protein
MPSLICDICKSTQFSEDHLGFFICGDCGTQSQALADVDEAEFNVTLTKYRVSRAPGKSKESIKTAAEHAEEVLSIFMEVLWVQCTELVKLHCASPLLHDAVGRLFFAYLRWWLHQGWKIHNGVTFFGRGFGRRQKQGVANKLSSPPTPTNPKPNKTPASRKQPRPTLDPESNSESDPAADTRDPNLADDNDDDFSLPKSPSGGTILPSSPSILSNKPPNLTGVPDPPTSPDSPTPNTSPPATVTPNAATSKQRASTRAGRFSVVARGLGPGFQFYPLRDSFAYS